MPSWAYPEIRLVWNGSFNASVGQPPWPKSAKRQFSRNLRPEAVAGVATTALVGA